MSTTVDSKVVEMRFDNKHFETNVATSMSTLDKFKQKLNLTGSAKGLENVGAAAKKIDMNPLGSAVETVRTKFSALEVMGVTALANITNSAVNAGKRIVHALTVAPVKDGWGEYELMLNSIQTTMAGTGKTAKEVEDELKKLDEYADKTVYSTADMLNNLPKFTNAGVELEKATTAMIGIANATALAGGDAGKASIAFYNLGQAIGTGYLTRMDYNSINNAGIATMEWKNQMVDAAVAAGTLKKAGDDLYEAGGQTFTLQQLFIDGLKEQWATTDVMMKVFGDYGDETTEIGSKAMESAKSIKTFTQMMESLKATAGTGWKDTWQIIFGGLDEAKEFWTGLSEFISGIITKMADFRNGILQSALGRGFGELSKKLSTISKPIQKTADTVKSVTKTLEDLDDIVNRVIRGEFGNGVPRYDELTEAGINYYEVQNKVNEKLNNGFRYSKKVIDAQDELLGKQKKTTKSTKDATKATSDLSKADQELIADLTKLSDAELKALGYTDDQIEALKELKKLSEKLGIPIKELIANLDNLNGRMILINSFKNIGKGLVQIFTSIKDAFVDIFNISKDSLGDSLFDVIAGFHKLTAKFLNYITDHSGEITRIFKGLFAAIDLVATITSGALRFAFKVVDKVLGYFNLDILGLIANVGDAIVKFRDWVKVIFNFSDAVDRVATFVKNAFGSIKEWFAGLKETDNIPKYIIDGLVNGLKAGATAVWNAATEIGRNILTSIKNFLGIHSPSTEMYTVGENVIQGLVNGLKNGASAVWETIKKIAAGIVEFIKNIDFGAILAVGLGAGLLFLTKKLIDTVSLFAAPLDGLSEMFEGLGKAFKASAWNIRAKAIKNIAISIFLLAASVALLTLVDETRLWSAVGAVAALSVILAGLIAVAGLVSKLGAIKMGGMGLAFVGIAASLLILAFAVKQLDSVPMENMPDLMKKVGILGGALMALVVISKIVGNDVAKLGGMLFLMSAAFMVMVVVIKRIAKIDPETMTSGLIGITLLGLIFAGLIGASKMAGANAAKAGAMLLLMAGAFLIMTSVIKQISKIDPEAMANGLIGITALSLVFSGLIAISKLVGKDAFKAGAMLLLMSGAFLIMASVVKIISKMDGSELKKGLGIIAVLGGIFTGLIAITKFAGNNAAQAGIMLLSMAGAMVVLTGVLFILSKIDPSGLGRALGAITVLGSIFAGLIAITKFAKDCQSTLIILTVAIGLLAAALIGLSFIDPTKLGVAAGALSSVISTFALLVTVTKFAKNSKSMRKSLFTMLGVVAGLAAIIAALSFLDPKSVMTTTAALSWLLISFSASMAILGMTGRISKTVTKNMLPMLGVVTGLATILALMSVLDVTASINNAIALSVLLTAMSGALFILSYVGKTSMSAVGALAVMGLVVAELAVILGVMSYFNVEASLTTVASISILLIAMVGVLVVLGALKSITDKATTGLVLLSVMSLIVLGIGHILAEISKLPISTSFETVASLSLLLLSMSAALVILGVVGKLGLGAFIGVAALAALIIALGAVLVGLAALQTYVFDLESFLDTGIPILEKIGYALGSFFGNIVAGFSEAIFDTLPKLGTALSEFMTNAKPFIEGIKMVDFAMLEGITTLTAAILLLTTADLINGVTSFLMGGSSFADLGTELSLFIMNAMPFIMAARMIDPTVMEGVKTLAEAILILTGANLLEQLTSWFGGEASLAKFGEELASFGPGLVAFATSVSGLSEEALNAMKISAEAGKTLAEMAATFPNSGGWLGKIFGENDADTFGKQLEGFGLSLMAYGKSVEGIDAYIDGINSSVEASKGLTELADSMPNSGGFLADFLGDNTMDVFGQQLEGFGVSLMLYGATVNGIGDYTDGIKDSASAAKGLTELADSIPNSAGFLGDFLGDNTMDVFGKQLEGFGTSLMTYGLTVNGIGDYLTGIKASVSAASLLADVASSAKKIGKWDVGKSEFVKFGENIVKFGGYMAGYGKITAEIDTSGMSSVTTQVRRLTDLLSDMSETDFDGARSFKEALNNLAKTGVADFVKVFKNSDTKVKGAAGSMIKKFADGAKDKTNKVTSAIKSILKAAVKAVKEYYDSFYDAGHYLVKGLAAGISENDYKVEAKARAMAKAAADAAEDELDINSPSKVFRKIGTSIPEGFAQGIDRLSSVVTDSSVSMARLAVAGVKDSISRISDFINTDIDSQPTIRPVLDLSDVEANAGSISEIFGSGPSVRVLSNVKAISSMMNRRGQNGRNDDVVSAIDKLNKNLGKVGNTTYNSINGITYDDGSNISDAIKTIVRAVKVERRT